MYTLGREVFLHVDSKCMVRAELDDYRRWISHLNLDFYSTLGKYGWAVASKYFCDVTVGPRVSDFRSICINTKTSVLFNYIYFRNLPPSD
jgi:hypothetical protein